MGASAGASRWLDPLSQARFNAELACTVSYGLIDGEPMPGCAGRPVRDVAIVPISTSVQHEHGFRRRIAALRTFKPMKTVALLFVCLGNICRSPTAEAVMRAKVHEAGLADTIHLDSAGTGDWHVGAAPDPRACRAAMSRGYALDALRARQVSAGDFARFDLLLAMDHDNVVELRRRCPSEHGHKIRLLMEFARRYDTDIVDDPYFGGHEGFERVLDEVEDACDSLLAQLRQRYAI
ncbi:protein-tyrosine phosphatase [Burkholderia sp. b14]|nr:protein-tyrosine phosphatase [Burkholderia sp. b14]